MDAQEFTIFACNLPKAEHEIAKINRRAAKAGFPQMTLEVGEKREFVHDYEIQRFESIYRRRPTEEEITRLPHVEVVDVKLTGEEFVIEGYKFVGTLDLNTVPGSVIVNAVPGQSVPEEFFEHDGSCDHCGKIRRRSATFVLRNEETGEHIAVGRQCVRDFIGYDASGLLRFLERVDAVSGSFSMSDDDDMLLYQSGPRMAPTFCKYTVLATTAALINLYGWVPRSAAGIDRSPTSSEVSYVLDPPRFTDGKQRAAYLELIRTIEKTQAADLKTAWDAIAWLEEQDGNNEYLHNLRTLNEGERIPHKMFGYWCSLVATYLRAQEKLRLQERQKNTSEWVGDVKQRLEVKIKVAQTRTFDGLWGTTWMYTMLDDEGRTFVWFSSGRADLKDGREYVIKGTVKEHKLYNGWKQTMLSRVKVLEEIENDCA